MIRENIQNFNFSHRQITVSGGIAFFGKDGRTLKEVVENADKALYYSKEAGKNKVTFYINIFTYIMIKTFSIIPC